LRIIVFFFCLLPQDRDDIEVRIFSRRGKGATQRGEMGPARMFAARVAGYGVREMTVRQRTPQPHEKTPNLSGPADALQSAGRRWNAGRECREGTRARQDVNFV
jgi:hypothetical protein